MCSFTDITTFGTAQKEQCNHVTDDDKCTTGESNYYKVSINVHYSYTSTLLSRN